MEQGEARKIAAEVAAARLQRRRLDRLAGLVAIDDGYAVQWVANRLLEPRLGPVVGFKIGGTTERMRAFIRADRPIAGAIFARTVYRSGARLRCADFVEPGVETEIAVRLRRPLGPEGAPWTPETVAECVASLMPAIEIVDNRYTDHRHVGAPTIVADNAFNAASVLGYEHHRWQRLALAALRARTLVGGRLVAEDRSAMLMGHPFAALAWLANEMARLGRSLPAGSFVSLGTITAAQWLRGPASVRIEIDQLGAVDLQFV
ncbi:2-oxo-hept-4-ene-1,7-dioate hydratase [bacterium HR40]|nr:2-oxo-hept-4-ene-1,7-dioate hydratase [bacterium HR40]